MGNSKTKIYDRKRYGLVSEAGISADTALISAPRLVVAIDFGTYASGYAFQRRSAYEVNRLDIRHNTKWTAGSFNMFKTPTCLLLNAKQELDSFGYEAEKKFTELRLNGKKPDDWFFFKHFKMNLYRREDFNNEALIEDVFGKHLPLIDVLSKSIKFMKDHFIKYLENGGVPYPEAETKWAGIKASNLTIALEPECAAIYCSHLPRDQLSIKGDQGKLKYVLDPGSVVMVVDMGGGTVDITTVEIEREGTMKQIFTSGGGHWGGMKVDKRFLSLLSDIVGEDVFSEWVNNNFTEEYELRLEFESKKRGLKHPKEEGADSVFHIKLPPTLKDIWEKKRGKTVTEILQEGKDKKKTSGKFQISWSVLYSKYNSKMFYWRHK